MTRLVSKLILAGLFPLLFSLHACAGLKIEPVNPATLEDQQAYSDHAGIALKVGETVASFKLKNAANEIVSSQTILLQQHMMLLFYRGDWCPFCMSQMEDLQALLPLLKDFNIRLVAVSPDPVATVKNTERRFGKDYLFLSDPDLKVIRQFGIENEKQLPHPSIFLVDSEGILLWYYSSADYKVRPTASQLKEILEAKF
jgi:peroxiredoxin